MNMFYANNAIAIPSGLSNDKVAFSSVAIKKGESISPALDNENIVILLFDGKHGFISTESNLWKIEDPSVFCPDFGRIPYTIHALEDMNILFCSFAMNDWDRSFYGGWHLTFPFFSSYKNAVRFRDGNKSPELSSWSFIQPFQIGHVSLNFVTGRDGHVKSTGNTIQNQWVIPVGSSSFTINCSGQSVLSESNLVHLIPIRSCYSMDSSAEMEMSYFCIELFEEEDINKNYLAQIFNGRMTELQ